MVAEVALAQNSNCIAIATKEDYDTKIADMLDHDIYLAQEYIYTNPIITCMFAQNAPQPLMFEQTRETLIDVDRYKQFIDNAISRFRRSRSYKGYKAYLMCMGLDRCQILGNITTEMADIEMHHNFLTIFDIAILISQHILNTMGKLTSFDLVALLIQEHRLNNIPIVMLSKTAHQTYHDNPDFYIPLSMTFGKWWDLLIKYRYGITLDIAHKVIKYIDRCQQNNELTSLEYFRLKESMESWGRYNDYASASVLANYHNNYYGNGYIDNGVPAA